ncbi:hypothetical protein CEXT_753941 [Caerostris extrusa]|uniref:Uncharacterized protein n=1 Tax=Caerostris extrusa TaxID=172846 RepID=A0AAV4MJV9_CAEEX|nr:hypothetical protein CEXT_753941 [Caerostris extrusa]
MTNDNISEKSFIYTKHSVGEDATYVIKNKLYGCRKGRSLKHEIDKLPITASTQETVFILQFHHKPQSDPTFAKQSQNSRYRGLRSAWA